MLRLLAEDDRSSAAAGLGPRKRMMPLDVERARPRVLDAEALPPPPPQNAGPHPKRSDRSATLERKVRQLQQQQKRLPAVDAREAHRQVQNHEVHTWLKKHSGKAVPRTELSRRRRALLMGCFKLLDADSSGTIEPAELGVAMSTLGFSPGDVKLAFDACDRNRDGKLDFEDFIQLFTVAWAHRETRQAFQDSFARDMSEVVAQACRPVDSNGRTEDGAWAGDGDEPVSTSFPFALVANSHRITKLVDACDPVVREIRLPSLSRTAVKPAAPAAKAASSDGRKRTRPKLPLVAKAPAPRVAEACADAFLAAPKLPPLNEPL